MQLGFSESSEIFSFLQHSEIFKLAEGNTELLPLNRTEPNVGVGIKLHIKIILYNNHI